MQRDGTGREGVGNDPTDQARALSLPSLGSHPKIKDVIYQSCASGSRSATSSRDRLVEADLAMRFGVSKTPSARRLTLEADGLVVLRPHRGAEVSRLTAEEWSDLIFLRDALEVERSTRSWRR